MLLLKACPHCHGDLVFEQDRACGYFTCVQCGHILSSAQEQALGFRATTLGPLHVHSASRTASRRTSNFHARSKRRTHEHGDARHGKVQLLDPSFG
jgi:hypothetical protein